MRLITYLVTFHSFLLVTLSTSASTSLANLANPRPTSFANLVPFVPDLRSQIGLGPHSLTPRAIGPPARNTRSRVVIHRTASTAWHILRYGSFLIVTLRAILQDVRTYAAAQFPTQPITASFRIDTHMPLYMSFLLLVGDAQTHHPVLTWRDVDEAAAQMMEMLTDQGQSVPGVFGNVYSLDDVLLSTFMVDMGVRIDSRLAQAWQSPVVRLAG